MFPPLSSSRRDVAGEFTLRLDAWLPPFLFRRRRCRVEPNLHSVVGSRARLKKKKKKKKTREKKKRERV